MPNAQNFVEDFDKLPEWIKQQVVTYLDTNNVTAATMLQDAWFKNVGSRQIAKISHPHPHHAQVRDQQALFLNKLEVKKDKREADDEWIAL